MITLMSMNALNLYGSDDAREEQRYRMLEELIRSRDADIIAVQEIISGGQAEAAAGGRLTPTTEDKTPGAIAGVRRLAEATSRQWHVDGHPAVAVGGVKHHTALLWRDGITPVPGTLHTLNRDNAGMWHCAIACVFDLGGPRVRVGSVQLSPFDQSWARMDTSQLLTMFNRDDVPGFLGGDFNGLGAQQIIVDDSYEWYDKEPYGGKFGPPWHPDHGFQFDDSGQVDRQAAIRLEHPLVGRMRDCAIVTGTKWMPTTGFHSQDRHPNRRVDRWYATYHVPDAAVKGYSVTPVENLQVLIDGRTVELTDHAPIEVDVDETALAG
jgi:endonuclease/exonuclease/phosphatase family metal-dependent hydrolase